MISYVFLDSVFCFYSFVYIFFPTTKNVKWKLTTEAPVIADATNEEDEELLNALAASMENMKDAIGVSTTDKDITDTEKEEQTLSPKKPTYPPLPEEPKGDRNLLCRVGVRLPDGLRLQRNFLLTDPIQVTFSDLNPVLPL